MATGSNNTGGGGRLRLTTLETVDCRALDSVVVGMITAAASLSEIYVLFRDDFDDMDELAKAMRDAYANPPPAPPSSVPYRVGDVVVANFIEKGDGWYRCVVTAVSGAAEYTLRLLDYGSVEAAVPHSATRELRADLVRFRMMATRVALAGVAWIGDRAFVGAECLPYNVALLVKVVNYAQEGHVNVDITVLGDGGGDVNLIDELLAKNLVELTGVRTPAAAVEPRTVTTLHSLTVMGPPLSHASRFTGQITHRVGADGQGDTAAPPGGDYCYVQVLQVGSEHLAMLKQLLKAINECGFQPGYAPAVGEIVLAMCDGYPARAEVTRKHSNEGHDLLDYDVFFIDYGNSSRVSEVAELPAASDLRSPALGIRFRMCSLGAQFPAVFRDVQFTIVDGDGSPPLLAVYLPPGLLTPSVNNATTSGVSAVECATYNADDFDFVTSQDVQLFDLAGYARRRRQLTCYITCAVSGQDFYVVITAESLFTPTPYNDHYPLPSCTQCIDHTSAIMRMDERMRLLQKPYNGSPPYRPIKNELVVVVTPSGDRNLVNRRARVIDYNDDLFTLQLIDQGDILQTDISYIIKMPVALTSYPMYARRCTIKDYDFSNPIEERFLKPYSPEKCVFIHAERANNLLVVTLHDPLTYENVHPRSLSRPETIDDLFSALIRRNLPPMASFSSRRPLVEVLRVSGAHSFSVVSCEDGARSLFDTMKDQITEYLTAEGVTPTASRASCISEVNTPPPAAPAAATPAATPAPAAAAAAAVVGGGVTGSSGSDVGVLPEGEGDDGGGVFDPCIGDMLLALGANSVWQRSMLLDIITEHGAQCVYEVKCIDTDSVQKVTRVHAIPADLASIPRFAIDCNLLDTVASDWPPTAFDVLNALAIGVDATSVGSIYAVLDNADRTDRCIVTDLIVDGESILDDLMGSALTSRVVRKRGATLTDEETKAEDTDALVEDTTEISSEQRSCNGDGGSSGSLSGTSSIPTSSGSSGNVNDRSSSPTPSIDAPTASVVGSDDANRATDQTAPIITNRDADISAETTVAPQSTSKYRYSDLPPDAPLDSAVNQSFVYVRSATEFYLQPNAAVTGYAHFYQIAQAYCVFTKYKRTDLYTSGDLLFVMFENKWYRGRVVDLAEDGNLNINFIDFGNTELISLSNTRQLDDVFLYKPPFVTRCSVPDHLISNSTLVILQSLTGSDHKIRIVTKKNETYVVDLLNDDGSSVLPIVATPIEEQLRASTNVPDNKALSASLEEKQLKITREQDEIKHSEECVVSDCIQLKKENEELKVQLKEKEQNLKDIETNILSLF